jgi:hypothetical protein
MNNPYSPPGVSPAPYYPPPQSGFASAAPTETTIELLRQTRPWVLLLSVLSFIGSAIMLFLGIGMAVAGLAVGGEKGLPAMMGLAYVPFSLLYIYPGIKLWSYGSAIARLVASRAVGDLETALAQQKSFWKFAGIASIVMIVLYILAIVGVVVAAAAGAMGK